MSYEEQKETPDDNSSISKSFEPSNKDEQIISPNIIPQNLIEYKSDDNFELLKQPIEEISTVREMHQSIPQEKEKYNKQIHNETPIKSIIDIFNEEEEPRAGNQINDLEKQDKKISLIRDEFQKLFSNKSLEISRDLIEFQGNVLKELTQSSKEDQINRKECNKKIKRIDQILSFVNIIKNSVQLNLDILHLLLAKNTVDILKNTSTLKKFVGENIEMILNSWIITNLDSDQSGNIKQSPKASQNIKNYIFQDLKKALKLLKINGQKMESDISNIQSLNKGNLQKFSLTKMKKNLFDQIFNNKGNICIFPKVTKLDIKHSNIEDVQLDPYFPELERLEISLSKISFSKIGMIKLQRLTDLSLTRVHMTNSGWNILKKGLLNNKNLRENLEMISLFDNKLTLFSILDDDAGEDNCKKRFPNLKVIDLEQNKLSKFNGENLSVIDDFQLLNLASNNFAFMDNLESLKRCEKKIPKTLVLLQKNLFLFKTNSKEPYLKYIISTLERFNYQVKHLAFDFLFDKKNNALLNKLSFSLTIQESLRELSLSYCSLVNQDVIKLISSNSFVRLRKLDLSYNLLDDKLFKESKIDRNHLKEIEETAPASIEEEEVKYVFEQCSKLEVLNLSGNGFKGDSNDLDSLTEFLKTSVMIKKVEFYNCPLDESMNLLIKEIKKREKKIIEDTDKKEVKITKDCKEVKITKDCKEVKIIKEIIEAISTKRDLDKSLLPLFDFVQNMKNHCEDLKLYFKNNYSSSTAKKIRFNIKNIKLKKLSDRSIMMLPS